MDAESRASLGFDVGLDQEHDINRKNEVLINFTERDYLWITKLF